MRTFNDAAKRRWNISINVGTVARIRELTKVHILEIAGGEVLQQLGKDPVLLADVLFAASTPEAGDPLTREAFLAALDGDALESGSQALIEAVIDFFPSSRREVLRQMFQTAAEETAKDQEAVARKIESGEIERQIREVFEKQRQTPLSESAGNTEVSSVSILGPSPSDSLPG